MEHQICSKCGKSKPITHFGKNPHTPTGLKKVCRQCEAKANRERKIKQALEKQRIIDAYNKIIEESVGIKTPIISGISDDDIIIELRKRGYSGELQYSTSVTL